jgi:hypothetical protein
MTDRRSSRPDSPAFCSRFRVSSAFDPWLIAVFRIFSFVSFVVLSISIPTAEIAEIRRETRRLCVSPRPLRFIPYPFLLGVFAPLRESCFIFLPLILDPRSSSVPFVARFVRSAGPGGFVGFVGCARSGFP